MEFSKDNILETQKPIELWLKIGILLIPPFFAWFTLQKGRSTLSKALAFGWMALWMIYMTAGSNKNTPKDSTSKIQTASIGGISNSIESYTGENSKDLVITLKPETSWSENSYVSTTASEMSRILQKIKEKKSAQYSTVSFVAQGNVIDKYGKESPDVMFTTTYDMSEVEKIVNFENMTDVQLMNNFTVGEVGLSPVGRKLMAIFCSPENSLKEAQKFCLRAFSK